MLSIHPSVLRNREPILGVLQRVLPPTGLVLEVASGSGAHAAFLAPRLPQLRWQPTEARPEALPSITAWVHEAGAEGLLPPQLLDATSTRWPVPAAAAMVCINMIHITPWQATTGLLAGARRTLPPGGVLYLYGPYRLGGQHTAPSNARFDAWLQGQDPRWGVRDLDAVVAEAARHGLELVERVEMPANNQSVVFARRA